MIKRTMSMIFLMIICLILLHLTAMAETTNLYPAEDEYGLYGYINEKGEWVIKPQYEDAEDFCGDYAILLKPGQDN